MIEKDYLIKQLKNLGDRVVLDKKWKKEQRQFLVSQLNAQLDNIDGIEIHHELKILSYFQTLLKPVVLLLVFVLSSGWLSVMASENSLPGDLLYPIKINSEKVKIALTFDKTKEAELHMESAKKRVQEIQELKKQDIVVEAGIVKETYDRVKVSVSDAQGVLKELKDENEVEEAVIEESEALMQAANVIDEGLKEISDNLDTLSDDVLEEKIIGGDAPVEVPEDLLIGLENLNTAVDVIVDEMVKDTALVESEEVKGAMSEIIGRAVEEINKDTETLVHDLEDSQVDTSKEEQQGPELIEEKELSLNIKSEEDIVDDNIIVEGDVLEEVETNVTDQVGEENKVIDQELLTKIDDLLASELISDSLVDTKELNDLLTEEVVALLKVGNVDKALELLRKGQELTMKMQEVLVIKEDINGDSSDEVIVEETENISDDSQEEAIVLDDFQGEVQDEEIKNSVEEADTTELSTEIDEQIQEEQIEDIPIVEDETVSE